jgi:hypothetical protein
MISGSIFHDFDWEGTLCCVEEQLMRTMCFNGVVKVCLTTRPVSNSCQSAAHGFASKFGQWVWLFLDGLGSAIGLNKNNPTRMNDFLKDDVTLPRINKSMC